MIPIDLATRLQRAGLQWRPTPGDRFVIPDRGMDEELFVLSDMTVDIHHLPDGEVIGFNGTVEWALDSLDKDEALWLPREGQLRDLLAGTFRGLRRDGPDGRYTVALEVGGALREFPAPEVETAYGLALLHLVSGETVAADDLVTGGCEPSHRRS